MANRNVWGMMSEGQSPTEKRRANGDRKRSNWLHSIVAGAGIPTVSSPVAALVFDWYFFSVVDRLTHALRPIARALHQGDGNAQARPSTRFAGEHDSPGDFPVPPEERRDRASIKSLLVSIIRSAANPKTH
jgi:hypothetical protein